MFQYATNSNAQLVQNADKGISFNKKMAARIRHR